MVSWSVKTHVRGIHTEISLSSHVHQMNFTTGKAWDEYLNDSRFVQRFTIKTIRLWKFSGWRGETVKLNQTQWKYLFGFHIDFCLLNIYYYITSSFSARMVVLPSGELTCWAYILWCQYHSSSDCEGCKINIKSNSFSFMTIMRLKTM